MLLHTLEQATKTDSVYSKMEASAKEEEQAELLQIMTTLRRVKVEHDLAREEHEYWVKATEDLRDFSGQVIQQSAVSSFHSKYALTTDMIGWICRYCSSGHTNSQDAHLVPAYFE